MIDGLQAKEGPDHLIVCDGRHNQCRAANANSTEPESTPKIALAEDVIYLRLLDEGRRDKV